MNENLKYKFKILVNEQLAIKIREQDFKRFERFISTRMKILKISSFDEYYNYLSGFNSTTNWKEWRRLSDGITTSETFFFRDKGQFGLLENTILPELIDIRRKEKSLRIWSAGCSTGEEAYSIAILVDRLLADKKGWSIFILGTDISEEVIKKAQKGVYSQWSFRMFDKGLLNQYFTGSGDRWTINENIRQMVTFRHGNLKLDDYPSSVSGIYDMDLILCRNVFIYFDKESIATIIAKIGNTLRREGYFITAHSELSGQKLVNLKQKFYPESVVYQPGVPAISSTKKLSELESSLKKIEKDLKATNSVIPKTFTTPNTPKYQSKAPKPKVKKPSVKPSPTISPEPPKLDSKEILKHLKDLYRTGSYYKVVDEAQQHLKNFPKSIEVLFLIGQCYANLGEHAKATDYCNEALKVEPYFVKPYLLLSQIAQENGDIEDAKLFLNKIIYLDPNNIAGYLELASILDLEGNSLRVDKLRKTALKILKTLPPETLIEPYENLTAKGLIETIKGMVRI